MRTITTYKGVKLQENKSNKLVHWCPYAVYLSNGNRFEFDTIAQFKRAVNGLHKFGLMELCPDGKWRGAGVKPGEFKDYAIKYQTKI